MAYHLLCFCLYLGIARKNMKYPLDLSLPPSFSKSASKRLAHKLNSSAKSSCGRSVGLTWVSATLPSGLPSLNVSIVASLAASNTSRALGKPWQHVLAYTFQLLNRRTVVGSPWQPLFGKRFISLKRHDPSRLPSVTCAYACSELLIEAALINCKAGDCPFDLHFFGCCHF